MTRIRSNRRNPLKKAGFQCLSGRFWQSRAKIDGVFQRLKRGETPAELRAAKYQIHRLTGDREGEYAIAISAKLRVVFRFEDGNAYDVDVVDYHSS